MSIVIYAADLVAESPKRDGKNAGHPLPLRRRLHHLEFQAAEGNGRFVTGEI